MSGCSICGVAYNIKQRTCKEAECLEKVLKEHPELKRYKRIKKEKTTREKKRTSIKGRYYSIKKRSKKKGLEIDITENDIEKLIDSPCVYCGDTKRIEIDRMDSKKGYTKDNVVSACRRCNTIKNDVVTYAEMIEIVKVLKWQKV